MERFIPSRGPSVASLIRHRLGRLCLGGSLIASFGLLVLPPMAQATAVTSPYYPGITCQVEQVPMRDGTLLTTYVYIPDGGGKYPVIMERNPYGRLYGGDACFNGVSGLMAAYAEHGYVGIDQDVRGTYTSGGTYDPVVQEGTDGYDAVEWAASQPWSTGKVGMTGSSYLAITQWQVAALHPPHLAAIAPNIMGSDYHDNNVYVNAVPNLWLMMSWPAETIVPDQIVRTEGAKGMPPDQIAQDVSQWYTLVNQEMRSSWVWDLPLTSFTLFQQYAPIYYRWLAHPSYGPSWAQIDTSKHYSDIRVPALVSGDWYDPFQVGTIQDYESMRAQGGTTGAREGTHLIMGAYGHPGDSGTPTFGDDTPDPSIQMAFFAHYLKGVDNGYQDSPRVHLYVLVPPNSGNKGSGFWITGSSYPLPGTHTVRYYLHSDGHANTRFGDGRLSTSEHPGEGQEVPRQGPTEAVDHFTYDPSDPVPTTGGNMCCDTALLPAGAQNQNTVEERSDVLVYTSAPLEHDVAVIGIVNAAFWAASSARDTDFTVKLVDVHPDGLTHNVLDRIVRARYRHGSQSPPALIVPHKPYHYTLELGNTATIFRAGHRIRVEISSSNFPHFARNLNTGLNNNDTSEMRIARQTLFHDPGHPSYISLPADPSVHAPGD
ncbi:MAG TPA: CocE/NonD family hydrolase [Gammaproteobacteria bacterium]|nr:CocE/NonD family hydrolase [Gammaproteobacteria bacterium]